MLELLGFVFLGAVANAILPTPPKTQHSKYHISNDTLLKKFLQDDVTKTSDADHQDSDDFVY